MELSIYRVTLPGEGTVLTRQTLQIKENEMILPREKKRKKGRRINSQTEDEKKTRYSKL